MNVPYRPIALALAGLALSAVVLQRAQAGGSHFYAPVADPVVKEECGGCHLAYPPAMLPARSWRLMMGGLDKHFGDDASLDAETAAKITSYLVANSADASGRRYGEKLLRGLPDSQTPLRITELPKWVREHRKVPAWEWKHKDVRTKANCAACHADAPRGYFDD